MANAIKKISLQKGYDVTEYVLCCFGGAGGQVACLIAETLGMKKIFLHPYAGVLSAYGMGLADVRAIKETGVEKPLNQTLISQLKQLMQSLEIQARTTIKSEETTREEIVRKINLKYDGTNSTLNINFADDVALMQKQFETEHQTRYGFIQLQKTLIVESVSVEIIKKMDTPEEPLITRNRALNETPAPVEIVKMFTLDKWHNTPIYRRENLQPEDSIIGPAIIVEKISTIVVEPNWKATLTERNHLILERFV